MFNLKKLHKLQVKTILLHIKNKKNLIKSNLYKNKLFNKMLKIKFLKHKMLKIKIDI